jgi:predicted glycogen debranching enzyme
MKLSILQTKFVPMSYVNFSPSKLTNLEFTTKREIVRTNHAGSYISTTLNGCNTRKYHGLLVCPINSLGGGKHVLLSALDESIKVKGAIFNLAVRRFEGGYIEPRGNKYLQKFDYEKIPRFTFQIGEITLTKERLLVEKEQQLLVKYTLEESPVPVILRFRPFLAFRNIHDLCKSNMYIQTRFNEENNGISLRLYDGFPRLFMQFSSKPEFLSSPDWHYNIEYIKEKNRGYPCLEDLYTPGVFEVVLKKSESLIFSAATFPGNPVTFKQRYSREVSKRVNRDSFIGCLKNSANQFIQFKDDVAVDIIAGYPWYNSISRETFISLSGLRVAQSERRLALEVLSTYLPYLKNGLFPNSISDNFPVYHSADASLWFIWAMQNMKTHGSRFKEFGPPFYQAIKEILWNYRKGTPLVTMLEDGLLFAAEQGIALTWMDSYSYGQPNVPRYGKPVEINALWYNAVCFGIESAKNEKDTDFLEEWKYLPEKIAESFIKAFWNDGKGYLADVENGLFTDWSVRPNMVIATAMPYTPLSREQREKTIEVVRHHLLTPRGLRSLSPEDPAYRGSVDGSPDQREEATHKGAAFPWLIQFFAKTWLSLYGKTGIPFLKKLIHGFESEMSDNCIGTVSEMYDGSSPHPGKGAISQAWNVAALLYTMQLISEVETE